MPAATTNNRRPTTPTPATLGELLMDLIEDGRLTRDALAVAACQCRDSAERWVNSKREPSFTSLRLLIRNLPADVAHDLLTLLLAGSAFPTPAPQQGDSDDVNGDGRVDLDDAFDSALNANDAMNETMRELRSMERGDLAAGLPAALAKAARSQRAMQTVVRVMSRVAGCGGAVTTSKPGPRIAREGRAAS